MNTLYDLPGRELMRSGKILRVRIVRPAGALRAGQAGRKAGVDGLLTYKCPVPGSSPRSGDSKYKIREELEVQCQDAAALQHVLEGIGLRPCFRYEKYRSTFRLPGFRGLVVDLDETPIGDYLELEGDRAEIDRCAALLGFRPADYVVQSYGALFLEHRRSGRRRAAGRKEVSRSSRPGDMLFRRQK
jgi:adenylate cyclase class 2